MKSIQKLNSKLQKIKEIEEYIINCEYVEKVPVVKLVQYKLSMKRKDNILKEIELVKRFAKGSKLLYEYDTNNWINDLNINCRKYCRMERKARYNRDLKLYKCGYKSEKPISLTMQNIKYLKRICFNKLTKLKSYIFSQKDNKIKLNNNYEDKAKKFRESIRISKGGYIQKNAIGNNKKIIVRKNNFAIEHEL